MIIDARYYTVAVGKMAGYFPVGTGPLKRTVNGGCVEHQESRLLVPTAFSPLK